MTSQDTDATETVQWSIFDTIAATLRYAAGARTAILTGIDEEQRRLYVGPRYQGYFIHITDEEMWDKVNRLPFGVMGAHCWVDLDEVGPLVEQEPTS